MRLALCLFVLSGIVAFAEVPEEQKQLLWKELSADPFLNITKYPTEEKQWILDWILNDARKQVGISDDAYDTQLLQLGHMPTIEKYGKRIAGNDFQGPEVMRSNQPRLIKYFEPIFLKEEPAWIAQTGHMTLWPRSISAMGIVMQIMASSGEISSASRAWAVDLLEEMDRMGGNDPKMRRGLEEGRSIFRDWWAENKQAVVEEKFSEVKPGKVHSFILEKQPKPEPITPAVSVLKRPESLAVGSASRNEVQTQEASETAKEESHWYWAIPAIFVAGMLGLVAVFRRNHKQSVLRRG